MNLQPISFKPSAYTCALTEKLDVLAGLTERKVFRHYVLLDMDNSLIIRVPGGTVGVARFDADGKICEIKVDRDYVVKTYPENLDEELFHFLGESVIVNCESNKRETC